MSWKTCYPSGNMRYLKKKDGSLVLQQEIVYLEWSGPRRCSPLPSKWCDVPIVEEE